MKKLIVVFMMLVCICSLVKAENYSGTLVVKVNGVEQFNQQSTVVATQSGANAVLNINSFSFAGIPVKMNITLNCGCEGGVLTMPATLTITPAFVGTLLGELELKDLQGTLNNGKCTLDMTIYSPKLSQNIEIIFK